MATSSMAIDTSVIEELADDEAVGATKIDANTDEIVDKFNSSLETATGHYHDGTDARPVYGGASGWTAEEVFFGLIIGCFGGGEI